MTKKFCLQEKNSEGAFPVFLGLSRVEEVWETGVSLFFIFFVRQSPKFSARNPSRCLKVSGILKLCA